MKAKYALRALCALAQAYPRRVQARLIAAQAKVPEKFLEAILVELRKAGFVSSTRGIVGGHPHPRPAAEKIIGDLKRAIDRRTLAEFAAASMTEDRLPQD